MVGLVVVLVIGLALLRSSTSHGYRDGKTLEDSELERSLKEGKDVLIEVSGFVASFIFPSYE